VIAIDSMTIDNGCLRVIPGSHKLGRLEHEDIVWNNMGHKKRAKHSEVKKAFEEFGIVNCEMKPGDMLFFNHYLLHGSSSNISPLERKVVIMQVQHHNIEKDMGVFNKYSKHRSGFLVKTYQDKIDSELNSNKYEDFNESYN
jgi:ectoine hydroxylase-related dioxygenase (phytanoyl-CoA dioxygenase family)